MSLNPPFLDLDALASGQLDDGIGPTFEVVAVGDEHIRSLAVFVAKLAIGPTSQFSVASPQEASRGRGEDARSAAQRFR